MKLIFFTLFIFFSCQHVQAQDEPEDFKIINQLLFELEQNGRFSIFCHNGQPEDIVKVMKSLFIAPCSPLPAVELDVF